MPDTPTHTRTDILRRAVKALVCLLAFEITTAVVQALVLFQHLWALVFRQANEPVRRVTNRACCLAARLLRYAGLCDNAAPFPFASFPAESDCPPATERPDFRE